MAVQSCTPQNHRYVVGPKELEIERANGRWPLASARSRSDGAAPLIGSSLAIRLVRDRIERVTATDALKTLPQSLATDSERLARFRRDVEVLASLNHPNIAAIYGLDRRDR